MNPERRSLMAWVQGLPPGYNFRPEDYERLSRLDELDKDDRAAGRSQRAEAAIRDLTVIKMPGKSAATAAAASAAAATGPISLDGDGDEFIDLVESPVAAPAAASSSSSSSSSAAAPPPRADDDANCTVCLEPMAPGQNVALLPCMHKLHHACIAPWLRISLTCPICKTKIS